MSAKKKKRVQPCLMIEVTYPAKYYFDTDAEVRIKKAAGYSDGSGMGFGVRDHSWFPRTRKQAAKKLAKLRQIKSIKGLKVKLIEC